EGMRWPEGYIEGVRFLNKVVDEDDLRKLNLLRIALGNGGMLRRHRGAFVTTKRGRHLIAPGREGALFLALWVAYFLETNLGYTDRMPDDPVLQFCFGSIMLAAVDADEDWVGIEELRQYVVVGHGIWDREESFFGDRQWAPNLAVQLRLLEPLEDFGLVEIDGERARFVRHVRAVRATSLLRAFATEVPAGQRHAGGNVTIASAAEEFLELRAYDTAAAELARLREAIELYLLYFDMRGLALLSAKDAAAVVTARRFAADAMAAGVLPVDRALDGIVDFFEHFVIAHAETPKAIRSYGRELGRFFKWLGDSDTVRRLEAEGALIDIDEASRRGAQAAEIAEMLRDEVHLSDELDDIDQPSRLVQAEFRVIGCRSGELNLVDLATAKDYLGVGVRLVSGDEVPQGLLITGSIALFEDGTKRLAEVWTVYPG
ncbi:MAG: hypothetical protein Q8K99_08315, partial [Actinomycetota bacterium]|nr:hypothetical protein [Actinomycetota bacterium]